jgi:hypothetical protein
MKKATFHRNGLKKTIKMNERTIFTITIIISKIKLYIQRAEINDGIN